MYKKSIISLRTYIKNVIPNLPVFDATKDFTKPDNYASIYITNINPVSNHDTLQKEYLETRESDNKEVKVFEYKEDSYLTVRVDFRGDNSYENIALFKNSFLKDEKRELLKEAGLGYLSFSNYTPLPLLRSTKAKAGMTITLKFFVTETIKDEAQIIKIFDIDVSKI